MRFGCVFVDDRRARVRAGSTDRPTRIFMAEIWFLKHAGMIDDRVECGAFRAANAVWSGG